MRVFLSWSGTRSKYVAQCLHDWLPDVIQALAPWMSAEDIQMGTRWDAEIAGVLEETAVGIVCLTPENQERRWINFEAGAISKAVRDRSRLIPYLIGISREQVTFPLAQFQMATATRADTFAMLKSLNDALGDDKLTAERLEHYFDSFWPELEEKLRNIPEPTEDMPDARTPDEILAEILENTRETLRRQEPSLDETGQLNTAPSFQYVIFANPGDNFQWRIVDFEGHVVALSDEDYASVDDALAAALNVHRALQEAEIADLDDAAAIGEVR